MRCDRVVGGEEPRDIVMNKRTHIASAGFHAQMACARRQPKHQHDRRRLASDEGREFGIDGVVTRWKYMGDPPHSDKTWVPLPRERTHQGAGGIEGCTRKGAKAREEYGVHSDAT